MPTLFRQLDAILLRAGLEALEFHDWRKRKGRPSGRPQIDYKPLGF
jgi:hypothetical protein